MKAREEQRNEITADLRCEELEEATQSGFDESDRKLQKEKEFIEQLLSLHQYQRYFYPEYSHDRLTVSPNRQTLQRREYYELFPVAMAPCPSILCSSIHLKFSHLTSSATSSFPSSYDCSIGLLPQQLYQYDFNLADHVGVCEDSFGVLFRKRADEFVGTMDIRSSGRQSSAQRILQTVASGDVFSVLMTPRRERGEVTVEEREGHFFHNFRYLGSGHQLAGQCGGEYLFAVVPSPNCCFEMISPHSEDKEWNDRIRSLLTQIMEPRESHPDAPSDDKCREEPGRGYADRRRLQKIDATEELSEGKTVHQDTILNLPGSGSSLPLHQISSNLSTALIEPSQRPAPPVPSFFPSKASLPLSQLQWIRPKTVAQSKQSSSSCSSSSARNEETSESMDCCICLSAQKCILLMPCKHVCLCEACGEGQAISSRESKESTNSTAPKSFNIQYCPICRKKIQHRMKIYF